MQNNGGEGGIRTHGRLPFNGFQDRRFRPLSHLSRFGALIIPSGGAGSQRQRVRDLGYRPPPEAVGGVDGVGVCCATGSAASHLYMTKAST